MKTQVFVLVPYDMPPADISEFVRLLLDRHQQTAGAPHLGRFDCLVGPLEKSLIDPVGDGRLPPKVRRAYSGNICERARLPADLVPGALVTPDGNWYDLQDFGWKMTAEPGPANHVAVEAWTARYRQLIADHPDCRVVEIWAHS